MKIIQLLEENDANINIKNGGGLTPLQLAIENNKKDIFFYLLSKGAKFVTQTQAGKPLRVDPMILEEYFQQKCITFNYSKNTLGLNFEVFKSDVKNAANEKQEGIELKEICSDGKDTRLEVTPQPRIKFLSSEFKNPTNFKETVFFLSVDFNV